MADSVPSSPDTAGSTTDWVPPDPDWVKRPTVVVTGDQPDDLCGYSVDAISALGWDNLPGAAVLVGCPYNSMEPGMVGTSLPFYSGAFLLSANTPGGTVAEVYDAAVPPWDGDNSGNGAAVSFPGDLTGDGVQDLAIQDYNNDFDGTVRIVAGPVSGLVGENEAAAWLDWDLSFSPGEVFAGPVDLNTDGHDDLLTSGWPGIEAERALVVGWWGPMEGGYSILSPDVTLSAPIEDGRVLSIRVGDLNGDGIDDVTLGQEYAFTGTGGAYAVLGPFAGETEFDTESDRAWSGDPRTGLGHAGMALAQGDLDGDGQLDVFVGAPLANGGDGIGYLDLGGEGGPLAELEIQVIPRHPQDWMGYAADVGDVDGDGASDLVVTAPRNVYAGFDRPGRALLFRGPLHSGTYGDDTADGVVIKGDTPDDFGHKIRVVDLDDDGADDLVVGAAGDPGYAWDAGSVTLMLDPLGRTP